MSVNTWKKITSKYQKHAGSTDSVLGYIYSHGGGIAIAGIILHACMQLSDSLYNKINESVLLSHCCDVPLHAVEISSLMVNKQL